MDKQYLSILKKIRSEVIAVSIAQSIKNVDAASEQDLYDATRYAWKIDDTKVKNIKYVVGVRDQKARIIIKITEMNKVNENTIVPNSGKPETSSDIIGKRYYFDGEINPKEYNGILGKDITPFFGKMNASIQYPKNIGDVDITNSTSLEHEANMSNTPLNQILYGPPGTGKTYNSVIKALEIIEPEVIEQFKADGEEYKDYKNELLPKYNELKKAGQIEFVTFHQSYGYEEFVEGIKPIPVGKKGNEAGSEMIYDVVDGVFKKICNKATKNYEDSLLTIEQFDELQNYKNRFSSFLDSAIENQQKFRKTQGGVFYITGYDDDIITLFSEDSKFSNGSIQLQYNELEQILKYYILHSSDFSSSREQGRLVFGIKHARQRDTYYYNLLKVFLAEESVKDKDTKNIKPTSKNYVLIIDEINRGNISKIFGELITLIEQSKRAGNAEAMTVTLPYSDQFSVPKNLYIIGTMNTADRSIALMDTALRRRFDFVEMMPEPDLLKNLKISDENGADAGINLKSILETINQRIEYLYDRDHTIGHAYFMNVTTLAELNHVFANKIIPLLQEYFYDNWGKIRLVLADNQVIGEEYQFIIKKDPEVGNFFGSTNRDDIDGNETIYRINDKLKESKLQKEAFIKIYEKINENKSER